MKKILTSLVLLGAVAGSSFAQDRTIDLQVITNISNGDTIVIDSVNSVSYALQTGFVNNGTDNMMEGDSIHWAAPYGSFYYVLGAEDVFNAGDTLCCFADTVSFNNGPETGDFQWCDSVWATPTTGTITDPNPESECVTIYISNTNGTTGIFGIDHKKTALNIYPNPANANVNVKYNFTSTTEAGIRVVDVTGRTVINNDLGKQVAGEKVFTVDISSLAPGMYTVELVTDDVRAISKLTVTK